MFVDCGMHMLLQNLINLTPIFYWCVILMRIKKLTP